MRLFCVFVMRSRTHRRTLLLDVVVVVHANREHEYNTREPRNVLSRTANRLLAGYRLDDAVANWAMHGSANRAARATRVIWKMIARSRAARCVARGAAENENINKVIPAVLYQLQGLHGGINL